MFTYVLVCCKDFQVGWWSACWCLQQAVGAIRYLLQIMTWKLLINFDDTSSCLSLLFCSVLENLTLPRQMCPPSAQFGLNYSCAPHSRLILKLCVIHPKVWVIRSRRLMELVSKQMSFLPLPSVFKSNIKGSNFFSQKTIFISLESYVKAESSVVPCLGLSWP